MKGRVFAISRAGGLFPARMAKGWLLSCQKVKAPDELYEDACAFFDATLTHRSEHCGGSAYCLNTAAKMSLSDALDWAKDHHTRATNFETDEEGYFSIGGHAQESILGIAFGQAGRMECVWIEQAVISGDSSKQLKWGKPFSASE